MKDLVSYKSGLAQKAIINFFFMINFQTNGTISFVTTKSELFGTS